MPVTLPKVFTKTGPEDTAWINNNTHFVLNAAARLYIRSFH